MPLDALGRTRATMPDAAGVFPTPRGAGNPLKVLCRLCISLNVVVCVCACLSLSAAGADARHDGGGTRARARASTRRARAWGLQFFPTNEECLVAASH